MLAGAAKTALFAGALKDTAGGASTVTLSAAEVVLAPRLSVATALSVWLPAGALASVAP